MAGWSTSPALFADQIEKDLTEMQRQIVLELVDQVVINSPIDSGNYMGNHIVSIGAEDYSVNTRLDVLGAETKSAARAALTDLRPFSRVVLQNNSAYGEVIEFGGYPSGPSVKITPDGYSRMAPKGVYGISFIAVTEKWT